MILSLALSLFAAPPQAEVTVYRAAKLYTADEAGMIDRGALIVRDGKVAWVGPQREAEYDGDAEVVDLGEVWLVPGLVEPHCHVAGSLRDLNDGVYLANPELDTHQVVEPQTNYLRDALAGGVTTALLIPGSGNNMAGMGTLVKTSGETVEEMVVRAPGSLKVAQAGNPERYSWFVGRALMNWNTRRTLAEGLQWAEDYQQGEAAYDPKWADFVGLRNGTVPVSVHTQIYQVVLATLTMQVQNLGLSSFVDHGTFDGYKTAPQAAELGVPVMNGPRQFWFDRSRSRIVGCAEGWSREPDLVLGYNTDAPVIPQEELTFQAAMGVRLGAGDGLDALHGMTANASRALLIEDLAGRLAPGLDADFVAWSGDPVDPRSHVLKTWVRGELVYCAERDGRRF